MNDETQEPPTEEKTMRSRYSFALELVPYQYGTFHGTHEDRKLPRNEVLRGLRDAADGFHYMGLQMLDTRTDEAEANRIAWGLLNARRYKRGHHRSIVELSTFKKGNGGWRFSCRVTVPRSLVTNTIDTLTIDTVPQKKGSMGWQ
jgi:uncharacterized protein YchJ